MSQKERDALESWLYDYLDKNVASNSCGQQAYDIAEHVYPDETPAPALRCCCKDHAHIIGRECWHCPIHGNRGTEYGFEPAPPEAARRWRCEKHPDYISPDHHKPVWHSGPTGGNYCEGPFVVEDSGSAGGGA